MHIGNRNLLLTVISFTLVLLLAACGGGSDDGEGSGFVELLEVIPDSAQTSAWVQVNDYQRFREAFDIQLPGPEADADALIEYLLRPIDMPQFFGSFISG